MQGVMSWLARKAVLYLLLIAAIVFFTFFWPNLREGLSATTLSQEFMSLSELKTELVNLRVSTQADLNRSAKSFRQDSRSRLTQRLVQARGELAELRSRTGDQGLFASIRPSKLLERGRIDLQISARRNEINALEAAIAAANSRDVHAAAREHLSKFQTVPTIPAIQATRHRCELARKNLAAFDKRYLFDRSFRKVMFHERSQLASALKQRCDQAKANAQRRANGIAAAAAERKARERVAEASRWTMGTVNDVSRSLERQTIRDILVKAAAALGLIILMPFLIRILFYFVLAPVAEKRPAVRFEFARSRLSAAIAKPSTTTVSIVLKHGEELLVRQHYLQTTSQRGQKRTQWLLDWRHPLSSLASGLTFLTRLRGEGQRTTISAVHDPFAEVALLQLPHGSAFVLHPRAVAAVVQAIDAPLRVTSHWRLFSLHALLTLQLRYLVFHGPAWLVLKGTRGIRAEQAERGRVFRPLQLVGFSADLAYGIVRTETFWPYFFGRDELLKDRVEAGEGLLIVEEAPGAGSRTWKVRRGLEGAFDAALKAVGL